MGNSYAAWGRSISGFLGRSDRGGSRKRNPSRKTVRKARPETVTAKKNGKDAALRGQN